jgi:hypothetical protein
LQTVQYRQIARAALLAATAFVFAGGCLRAQAPILRTNTVEIGPFIGGSYGIDQARVMGGGNIVYSLTREVQLLGEVSYFPGIGRKSTVSGLNGASSTFNIPITDFNFGMHFRLPIPKSHVIPYGVISFGAIHNSAHTEHISYTNPLGQPATTDYPVAASTNYATSFGAGIRYYVTERLGFRTEFKGYKPTGNLDAFYRVAGGFFYQF